MNSQFSSKLAEIFPRSLLRENALLVSWGQQLADLLMVTISFGACCLLYQLPTSGYLLSLLGISLVLTNWLFNSLGLYRSWRQDTLLLKSWQLCWAWLLVVCLILGFAYLTGSHYFFGRKFLVSWFLLSFAFLLPSHLVIKLLLYKVREWGYNSRSMLIVGAGELGLNTARKVLSAPQLGLQLVGFFDDAVKEVPTDLQIPVLGQLDDLLEYLEGQPVDVVAIALNFRHWDRIQQIYDRLRSRTSSVYFIPDIFTFDLVQASIQEIGGIPVIALRESPFLGPSQLIKRLIDLLVTIPVLLLIWPFLLLIALLIRLESPGEILFRQKRYGYKDEPINVCKFRTMHLIESGQAPLQAASEQDPRVTKLGRFLRKTSLDELPQLWNVLLGEMSIVGPRPHAVSQDDRFRELEGISDEYVWRYKVKPGITGWAQIHGNRGGDSPEQIKERIKYDLYYIRHWSPAMDLYIIGVTAWQFLGGLLTLGRASNAY